MITGKIRGFSLVELVVGMAILAFIMLSGFVVMQMMSRSSVFASKDHKVLKKMEKVADEIRIEAADNFFGFDDTNKDRTGVYDTDIQIYSTSLPVDKSKQSRQVLIKAVWPNKTGSGFNIRTTTITVTRFRAVNKGARVYACVVGAPGTPIAGLPVPGIIVSAPGEDSDFVEGSTRSNGCVDLENVKQESLPPGVPVTYSGLQAGYYFSPPFSWTKNPVPNSGPTYVGVQNVMPVLEVFPMARVKGTVTDFNNSSVKISNVRLVLYAKQISASYPPTIRNSYMGQKLAGQTDSQGRYEIGPVFPGTYAIAVLGDGKDYAALAKPDDSFLENTSPTYSTFNLAMYEIKTIDFSLPKKGHIDFSVRRAHFTSGAYDDQGAVTGVHNVRFRRFQSAAWHSGARFDLGNTTPWRYAKFVFPEEDLWWHVEAETDASGLGTWKNFTPIILHEDLSSYPPDDQYNKVWPKTVLAMQDPLTPITVVDTGTPANAKFLINVEDHDPDFAVIRPKSANWNDFGLDVMANGQTTNVPIYVLNRNSLVDIQGFMKWDDVSQNPVNIPVPGTVRVWMDQGSNSIGNVGAVAVDGSNNAYINTQYSVMTTSGCVNGFFNCYQMFNVVPNVGSDVTLIQYESNNNTVAANRAFRGVVKGYKKIRQGTVAKLVSENVDNVPSFSVDWFDSYHSPTPVPGWSEDIGPVNSGVVTSSPKTVTQDEKYLGDVQVALNPTLGIPTTVHVMVDPTPIGGKFNRYWLKSPTLIEDAPSTNFWHATLEYRGRTPFYHDSGNSRYNGWFRYYKRQKIIRIYGKVTDMDTGDEIHGARVTLKIRNGNTYEFNHPNGTEDDSGPTGLCGSQGCQYKFDTGYDFYALLGWNFYLCGDKGGEYSTQCTGGMQAWDNFDARVDLKLRRLRQGPPSTGTPSPPSPSPSPSPPPPSPPPPSPPPPPPPAATKPPVVDPVLDFDPGRGI